MPNAGAKKFPFHLLLQSEQGKMAGNGAGQQKKQQIFFRLTAFAGRRWRRVFNLGKEVFLQIACLFTLLSRYDASISNLI